MLALTPVQCLVVILHGGALFSAVMLFIATVRAMEEHFRGDLEYNDEVRKFLKNWAFISLFFGCLEIALWLTTH